MPSVLIIDDEQNIRRMVGALLAAEGYEVRDAAEGAAGIARAAEAEPDAVLLDLMMPGELDGMGTLARLRQLVVRNRLLRCENAPRRDPRAGRELCRAPRRLGRERSQCHVVTVMLPAGSREIDPAPIP